MRQALVLLLPADCIFMLVGIAYLFLPWMAYWGAYTVCNGVLPAGRMQTGAVHQVSAQVWAKNGYISIYRPLGRVPTGASHQALAQAWAKSSYISLYPGWHNGLYTMHNGGPPTGRVPTGASRHLSAPRALYRSCTSCSTLFVCTVCCILNKAIIIIIVKRELRAATSLINAYWEGANQGPR